MEVMAVYPGRFHPFHRGHASSFNQLAERFGLEHTLLAISGKQEQPKSPFSVGDRAKMAMAVGVPKENIISVKQPYKAEEYIKYIEDKGLDPQDFALVFAVSKKDMEGVPEMGIPPDPRFTFKPKRDGSPAYLQPYSGNENDLKNMLQHAYVVSTDVEEFPIAGETMRDASTIRSAYKTGDENKRNKILHDMYGKTAKHIKPIFDRELLQDAPSLREFYERIKPLLKEASIPKRVEMLKRLLEKRRRKTKHSGRSITTGWWGGLNLSGDGGGDGGGVEESLNEWVDPGAPCQVCGKPHGQHRVKFDRKNPKLSFINPNDEMNDLEMSNAEDHEYVSSKGYKPLSQQEAKLVGFHNLNVDIPDDIYDRINSVRQRIGRVGPKAGQLTRVKEQGVTEGSLKEFAPGAFGGGGEEREFPRWLSVLDEWLQQKGFTKLELVPGIGYKTQWQSTRDSREHIDVMFTPFEKKSGESESGVIKIQVTLIKNNQIVTNRPVIKKISPTDQYMEMVKLILSFAIQSRLDPNNQDVAEASSPAQQAELLERANKRLRKVVAEESNDKSIDDITSAFVEHYKEDPVGMYMHAKSSYLDAVGKAKNFSVKAAQLYKAHQSMSEDEFQNTVLAHFGPHLMKHGFPKHASTDWGEAEHDMMKALTGNVTEAASSAQQAAIAVNMKKAGKKPKKVDESVPDYLDETAPSK